MLTDTKLRNLKPRDKLYKVNDREGLYVGVASENGIYGHSRFCNTDFDENPVSSAPSTRMAVVSTGIRMYMCL